MTDTTTHPATTVALDIGGMTCASCAARITKRLNKLDGVEASVNYATERNDDGELTAQLTVSRDGALVTDLEPYLGASGHLVAMRSGDLAYAHVHPVDDDTAPGVVTFDAELTSAGRYGLFFDFKHHGTVHTASFTFDQGPVTGTPDMGM